MAQEAVLFLCEFEQAHAQPVQLAPEPLEVRGALDDDRLREAALAELVDRTVDLADRPADQQREEQHQQQGSGHQRGHLPCGDALRPARRLLQRAQLVVHECRKRRRQLRDLLPQRPEALYGGLGVRGTDFLAGHGSHYVTRLAPDHHRFFGRSRLVGQVRHCLQAPFDPAQVLAHDRAALVVAQDVVLVRGSLQLHEILGEQPVVLRRLDAGVNDAFALMRKRIEVDQCPDHGHQ